MQNQQTNSPSICFQRWSRKNFAVFTSLGKVVKIGVLASGISMLSAPTVKAEKTLIKDSLQTDREQTLSELTVVGSKVESLQGLNTTLPVIKSGDVDRLPIISLESALKQSASIDVRERGVRGVQADLSIRGGSFDQSLIFLNGVNFTDSRTGHQSLSLPIDIEIIDQINLLQGLTTPGALTGAINLITGSSNKNFLKAEINSGQYGYQLYRLNGNYRYKNSSIFAAASHKRSAGYIDNTDFENTNAFVHLKQRTTSAGNFDLQAGFQDKAFGANSFYTERYPNQYEATRTFLNSLGWNKQWDKFAVTSNGFSKLTYDRFELFRHFANAAAWYKNHNFHRTMDAGGSVQINYYSALGKTFAGADYKYVHIYSNNIGDSLQSPIAVHGAPNAFYFLEKERSTTNIYLKHRFYLNNFQAEGNLNYLFSSFGNELLWGASAKYQIASWLKAFANANHNIRIPTLTDLYYKSTSQISDPNLKMEKATTFDLGLEVKQGKFTVSASAFARQTKNAIDWVIRDPSNKWYSVNYSELNMQGVEVSSAYALNKLLNEIRFSYAYLHSDNPAGNWISKYALSYLKNKATCSAQLTLCPKLSLGVIGALWDRNDSYSEITNTQYTYDPYFTLDAKLTWKEKIYAIKLEGANITNTKYFDLGGLKQPGSWVNAGIVVNL